ncbi:MAG: phasin family protein [Rubrimonas sp.]
MPTKTTTTNVEAMTADVQKNVVEHMEKATKSMETVAAFNQETLDAMLKSQTIAAKAAEEIQAEVLAFSKKTVEETVAHAKELASVQTLNDFIEKQTGYAKATMDSMIRQSAKLNEMMVAATKEALAPLNARATAAADLMKAQA